MFNKTEILKNQKTNFIFKTRPKLQKSYNMKKSLTNLKISSAIYNNSSNGSNVNLKTSSNSKIEQDSSSIRKMKTLIPKKLKKSLFDYKDKEANKIFLKSKESREKFSKSNNDNNSKILLSAKMNKNNKLKLRSRTHLNTDENEMPSKGYYLTGELPFKDKYIVEIKDFDLNMNTSKKSENKIIKNKNQNINKNEFIQCDSINNSSLKNKILNMKRKDKKIDKLAKKLAIKLNLEDKKHSNQTKCECGNFISLKNGFFNGVNLVMSYTPRKEKNENSKAINENAEKNEENDISNYNHTQPGIIYSNGYNFIPTNLPLFLRDKYNIKGTTVLSPFCIEARDEFLFKKIFYDGERKKMSKRTNIVDNKLNIFYAENHKQYNKNLIKFNEKLKQKGRRVLHEVGPTPTEIKMNSIKNKMNFMKKIVDYAYPNMVLARVREKEKVYKKRNKSELNLPPFIRAEIVQKQRNRYLGDFLRQSFNIQNPINK